MQIFHGTTGDLITEWTAPQLPVQAPSKKSLNKAAAAVAAVEDKKPRTVEVNVGTREGSPSKKRKVEGEKVEPVRSSMLGVGALRGEGENGRNSVTKVLAVKDGAYVVVGTNEDKTIRVFEVKEDGKLKVLSERYAGPWPLSFRTLLLNRVISSGLNS